MSNRQLSIAVRRAPKSMGTTSSSRHSSRELKPEEVNKALNGVLDTIERYLTWQRTTAEPFNERIKLRLREAIEARKAKVLKDRNSVANLGFKLKGRADAPKTYVAPVVRKKIVPTIPKAATQAPFKPEPMLDDQTYSEILKIIENMTLVMERSPRAFATMREEDIRQHFLVQLNGQYEGDRDRRDLQLRGQDRHPHPPRRAQHLHRRVQVLERAEKLTETIDQLLGYTSWRDTKTAIFIFCRNRDFSGVLKSIQETTEAHPHKKRGPTKDGDTRLQVHFWQPRGPQPRGVPDNHGIQCPEHLKRRSRHYGRRCSACRTSTSNSPIQVEGFALVPTDDFRIEAIKKKQPRLRSFLKRFRTEFGDAVEPSTIIWRKDKPDSYRSIRRHIRLSRSHLDVCHSPELGRDHRFGHVHGPMYSDTFAVYPWMVDNRGEGLITQTPRFWPTMKLSGSVDRRWPRSPFISSTGATSICCC